MMDTGNVAVAAGIASAVTLIIRELVAGLIQLRGQSNEKEKQERADYEQRMKRYLAEAEADRDAAEKKRQEAVDAQMETFRKQIECEKNTIRLEAKVELLTRLSGIDLTETKVHKALQQIESEVTDRKNKESKDGR